MTFDQFQKRCLETAIYPTAKQGQQPGRSYCFAGLASELGELFEAVSYEDKLKEAGDVLWYIATLAHESGLGFHQVYLAASGTEHDWRVKAIATDPSIISALSLMALGKIGDALKKNMRDDEDGALGARREKVLEGLSILYLNVISFVSCVFSEMGKTPEGGVAEYLMDGVIAKLQSRKERGVLNGAGDNR